MSDFEVQRTAFFDSAYWIPHDTWSLLHEREQCAKEQSYEISEKYLTSFIEWAAKEIASTSTFERSEHIVSLYAILPTLLRSRDILKVLQAHPRFALTLEKFAYNSRTIHKEVPPPFQVRGMGQIWLETRADPPQNEQERRQIDRLASYISRLFARLEKQFNDHPYRSFEQVIYALHDPRTDAIRYIGMAHDIRRRYRRHLENREGTPQKKAWIAELLGEHLAPMLEILERGPETSYRAEEREFRWIRSHLRQNSPLTNVEASYRHLVQACQSVDMDVLTDPLSLWEPTPAWWILLEAQARDEMERSPASRKGT